MRKHCQLQPNNILIVYPKEKKLLITTGQQRITYQQKTTAQGPQVAQPMGNQPVSAAQPMRNHPAHQQQPIPPPVSQPVGPNLSYTFNSQPAQTTQVPLTIPQSISAPTTSHLNTIPQSYTTPVHHPSMILQSYITQTIFLRYLQ